MIDKTVILLTFFTLLGSVAATAEAISPESFACSRAIELERDADARQKSSLVAVPFTDDMFPWLGAGFHDLRVFDDKGGQVACDVVQVAPRTPQDKAYRLSPEAVTIEFEEALGQTLITLDTKRLPISEVKLQTPSRNFRRDLDVLVSQPGSLRQPWKLIQSTQIERIDLEGFEKETLTVSFPSERASTMQLKISHGENSPIEIEKVQLFGPAYECRFIAEPGRSYTLAYGSESVGPARLDAAALTAAQRRGLTPIEARLSEKIVQRTPSESEDVRAKYSLNEILTNSWLVYPVVILLVVLLGCGLVHAARRMPSFDSRNDENSRQD